MVTLVAALIAAQSISITVGSQDTTGRDSLRAERAMRRDSIRRADEARVPRRIPVTAEHLATAFRDAPARALLERVRVARMAHDSTLLAYDAKAYLRMSAGMSLRRFGRDRLLFRTETAGRVRWHRDHGAWIDVTGKRSAVPLLGSREAESEIRSEAGDVHVPIPYYPGRDALWVGRQMVRREVDDREIVHPLAVGAEAYYRYATGDSVSFELPDGGTIRLRELRIEAREPRWNLIVGSFWFDVASAQLVRAAYRLAIPMDIVEVAEADGDDDIPRWLRPMTATIAGITVEYGLHGGRWWLPRTQYADGEAVVSVMRVPFRLEESFRYASVNGLDTLPSFPDLAATDSVVTRDTTRWKRVVTGDEEYVRRTGPGGMPVISRMPRDSVALATSPDLPPSIYDAGDVLFDRSAADELMAALDFGLQAGWDPQRPQLSLPPGQGLVRYNRVEGLSLGARLDQRLGRGYAAALTARLGLADQEPNAELGIARGTGRDSLGMRVYRRLDAANEWGEPFGFGPSLSAFLFARDQGLYYRTGGAELRGVRERGGLLIWRVFAERQWGARVNTQLSLPRLLNDTRFIPNIAADKADLVGAELRYHRSAGYDPAGWRALGDLRLEGAAGDFGYGRAAADLTVSHALGGRAIGALTAGGGTSAGDVPVQRLWYLGGAHSVRGHEVGTMAGDAYWMGRAEVGATRTGIRPSLFYDVGWAGARGAFSAPGTPMQGAGLGLSFLDGLLRLDVAKGIRPVNGWRGEFYVEARF